MPLVATLRRAFTTLLLVIIGATRSAILLVHIALLVLLKGRRVLKPRERAQEPECLQDPALGGHDFITIEDATLHYVSAGKREKPLVLLLHGFPDFWFSWKHQILGLKSDFWVVALDLRGYGRSSKSDRVVDYRGSRLVEDVHQLIISLGKRKANIVAHDWGAVIAWWLATKYENLVDKLVIINGPHPLAMKYQLEHSLSQILRSWYLVTFQLPWLPETCFCMNDMKLLDTLLGAYDEEEREAMKYSFSKPGALTGPINYYRASFRLESDDLPPYRRLAVPALIVWGCHDAALTKDIAALTLQYAGSGRVEYVSDAGHWVHREQPKLVNDHIRRFLLGGGTNSPTGTLPFGSSASSKC
ncbi:epoxide hydrolase 4-like isoform X1 [Amblyomma americanum]